MSEDPEARKAAVLAACDQAHMHALHDLAELVKKARRSVESAGGDRNLGAGHLMLVMKRDYSPLALAGIAALALVELARREPS